MDANRVHFNEWILKEIQADYSFMLSSGATSVWETIEGAVAFDNAGSLCHGWSAVPTYVYHKLNVVKEKN